MKQRNRRWKTASFVAADQRFRANSFCLAEEERSIVKALFSDCFENTFWRRLPSALIRLPSDLLSAQKAKALASNYGEWTKQRARLRLPSDHARFLLGRMINRAEVRCRTHIFPHSTYLSGHANLKKLKSQKRLLVIINVIFIINIAALVVIFPSINFICLGFCLLCLFSTLLCAVKAELVHSLTRSLIKR